MLITGQTKLLGIIGNPVSHSASPLMHNTVLEAMKLPYVYVPFPIKNENELKTCLNSLSQMGVLGVNVTVPYKEKVIPFLTEIDTAAKLNKAVNTILFKDAMKIGYNTDGSGFILSLESEIGCSLVNKKVALLGAGGAARGISGALIDKGLKSLAIVNRSLDRANSLKQDLSQYSSIHIETLSLSDKELSSQLSKQDIVINTTSVGMSPNENASPVPKFDWVKKSHLCCDIVYKPYKTKFMLECERKGAQIFGGFGMLAGQGAIAFEHFTGEKVSYNQMRKALNYAHKI